MFWHPLGCSGLPLPCWGSSPPRAKARSRFGGELGSLTRVDLCFSLKPGTFLHQLFPAVTMKLLPKSRDVGDEEYFNLVGLHEQLHLPLLRPNLSSAHTCRQYGAPKRDANSTPPASQRPPSLASRPPVPLGGSARWAALLDSATWLQSQI